jgi:hypothetical protein
MDQWSVAGNQTFNTQEICLTPELDKFQQNLRFAIGNKGGFGLYRVWQVGEGLCVQLQWWSFINNQSCSFRKMNPEQVYCYTFLKTRGLY